MKHNRFLYQYRTEIIALTVFFLGAALSLLGLTQRVPLVVGVIGVTLLASGLFVYCLLYSSERAYKTYYKECYEIEHESIEEEIKKSMVYHRYQEAVLGRFESICRDLGISDEQRDYLLVLLMEERNKVDRQLAEEGNIIL